MAQQEKLPNRQTIGTTANKSQNHNNRTKTGIDIIYKEMLVLKRLQNGKKGQCYFES